MPYPTEKEIMAKPVAHKKTVLAFMKRWKAQHEKSGWHTTAAITEMLFGLAAIYKKPIKVIGINEKTAHYNPKEVKIALSNKSIITALHEFSHHVHGRSERQACRWSVWLFRKIFPQQFEKLEFKGHLLVTKPKIKINPSCPIILPPCLSTRANAAAPGRPK